MTSTGLMLEIEELVFDTLDLRSDALHAALAIEGLTLPLLAVREAHTGATAAMALDRLPQTTALDAVARDLVLKRTADHASARFEHHPPSFDAGARNSLERLSAECSLALVTRATRAEAQRMLEQAGIEACVRTIRSLGDLPLAEQHDVWRDAASRLHTGRCIAIAPAPLLSAARRAGLTTIAIGDRASDADATLVSLSQLDALFLSSLPRILEPS